MAPVNSVLPETIVKPNDYFYMPKDWLFTDLDGTLLPLDAQPQTLSDLPVLRKLLAKHSVPTVFVTGRHLASTLTTFEQFDLPQPQWIICDVGTRVFDFRTGIAVPSANYQNALRAIIAGWPREPLLNLVAQAEGADALTLQEEAKLSEFKLSFYTDRTKLPHLEASLRLLIKEHSLPFSVVASVDPFNQDGLIDLLPAGVNKAFAIRWLGQHLGIDHRASMIYCGDSGNDLAALQSGCRAVFVSNGDRAIAKNLVSHFADSPERLFLATQPATCGVLEGVQNFFDMPAS